MKVHDFSQMVPYHRSTAQVDLVGARDRVLASLRPGASAPQVNLRSPNGGEVLSGDRVRIEWSARDADGDPLTFNVDYSADNGQTWRLIAQGVTDTSVGVAASSLPASNEGRMRVWASDGINTDSDMSDGPFIVPNRPPLMQILQPEDDLYVVAGQTVFFEALVYDPDVDSSEELDIAWRSDLNGVLWEGSEFSTASLSVGAHRIMVMANDGAGDVGADSVRVTVVHSLEDLPPRPAQLLVAPEALHLHPCCGVPTGNIHVHNGGNLEPIAWQATASEPWVQLSKAGGETPDTLVVSVSEQALPVGIHTATITITSSDAPGQQAVVELFVTIEPTVDLWLPLISKR